MSIHFSYTKKDFEVNDGIEIVSAQTVIDKSVANTKENLRNTLITFWESATIKYRKSSNIFYKRINHLNYKYELTIRNTKKVKRKMMFRIFLGILEDEKDIKLYFYGLFDLYKKCLFQFLSFKPND